jgi:hypothetical protein
MIKEIYKIVKNAFGKCSYSILKYIFFKLLFLGLFDSFSNALVLHDELERLNKKGRTDEIRNTFVENDRWIKNFLWKSH